MRLKIRGVLKAFRVPSALSHPGTRLELSLCREIETRGVLSAEALGGATEAVNSGLGDRGMQPVPPARLPRSCNRIYGTLPPLGRRLWALSD